MGARRSYLSFQSLTEFLHVRRRSLTTTADSLWDGNEQSLHELGVLHNVALLDDIKE